MQKQFNTETLTENFTNNKKCFFIKKYGQKTYINDIIIKGKGGENMEEFVEKLKHGALKLKKEAGKLTGEVVQKTKETIDKTKYNYSISTAETRKKQILQELGAKLYEEYKNGAEFDGEVKEKCIQIDSIIEEIDEFKNQIAQINNSVVCPKCGALVNEKAVFCDKCGLKLDENK